MDTQTQIDRLIELAIVQRTELKQLVEQLPQLREHLNAEVERTIEEVEPQLRAELEEFCDKRAVDANAKVGSALEAKIVELSKNLELTTQARYNAIKDQERKVEELRQLAAKQIEGHVAALPEAVKEIVGAELARFPRAGEIDQLRKEFAEPKGLNPRGKWLPSETYNRLDLVTYNGDSFTSAIDGNRSRPSRNAAEWTLIAARGTGGGGPTSLSELTTVPSNGDLLIGSGTSWVTSNLTAGAGISITVGAGEITISATDGDITLDDGTAASPSLHFTNDPDTGIYRPAANTLGISVSGTQVAYFDQNGLTIPSAGIEAGGSIHAANGNANNPSLSFTGDQDTGFFRHQPNEIGVALGGTQYATLTSATFSVTPALSVAGASRVTNSTASSSTTTGALVVTGGVGIGGAANVGGNVIATGTLTVNSTTDSASKDTGAIVTEGGLGVEKSASIGGNLTVSGTGGITSTAPSPLLRGSTSVLGGVPKLTLEHTAIAAWNLYLSGTDGGDFKIDQDSTNRFRMALGTGNVTLSGNLTVSGGTVTGGSSGMTLASGGTNQSITITPNGTGATIAASSGADAVPALGAAGGRFRISTSGFGMLMGSDSSGAGWIQQQRVDGTATSYPLWLQPNGGNFLVGTTTDSSNGKLQLASHTTSAGGIGFGTDVSLWRNGAQSLLVGGDTAALLGLAVGGSRKAYIYHNGTDFSAGATTGQTILISNNTTALTLDSSQNATFAGNITSVAGSTVTLGSEIYGRDNTTNSTAKYSRFGVSHYTNAEEPMFICGGRSDATTNVLNIGGSSSVYNAATTTNFYAAANNTTVTGTLIASITTTGLAMASGKDISVGNAYVAGAPTATGYIVIKDSTGTSYKIPAVAL